LVDHLGKEELHHFTAAGGLVTAAVAAAGGVCACACACACACRGSAEKFEAGMAWPTLLVACSCGLQLWLAAVACSCGLQLWLAAVACSCGLQSLAPWSLT
jgi:hypothetical protein